MKVKDVEQPFKVMGNHSIAIDIVGHGSRPEKLYPGRVLGI